MQQKLLSLSLLLNRAKCIVLGCVFFSRLHSEHNFPELLLRFNLCRLKYLCSEAKLWCWVWDEQWKKNTYILQTLRPLLQLMQWNNGWRFPIRSSNPDSTEELFCGSVGWVSCLHRRIVQGFSIDFRPCCSRQMLRVWGWFLSVLRGQVKKKWLSVLQNAGEESVSVQWAWLECLIVSPKELSSPGTGCSGEWWNRHAWKDLKAI